MFHMALRSYQGITLIEVLVSLGIFSLLAMSIAWILINSIRHNAIIWEQLQTQTDGRRVLREVVDVTRRAEFSSLGSYPLATTTAYELAVYANIDRDSFRERVRFFANTASNTLQMGVIKPSGNPLTYSSANETITTLAQSVVNDDLNRPIFTYFDDRYTGTQAPLAQPVSTTQVAVIRIELELERNPTASPVPLHVESTVQIRNLKRN